MKPGDVAIWERYIEKYPDAYDKVQYDFWVGSPPPFNPIVNEATEGSADGLYRRKIDVVGYKNDTIDIIEVKPRAGASAIGQVKGYKRLFVRDEKPKKEPQAIILTDILDVDMLDLTRGEGVLLFIV